MAIYINEITVVADAVVEPVSRTDAKNWMRITDYTSDDTLIDELITSARKHIEKLTGLSLANKKLKAYIELTGEVPEVWMVDVPYGPLLCVDEVKYKIGLNNWDVIEANLDYEKIGTKLWFYAAGNYEITYQAGFSDVPADLENDILTLVAWMYQNRGKAFQGSAREGLMKEYPNWDGLNYHQYKKVVI